MGILRKITAGFLLFTSILAQQKVGGVAFYGNAAISQFELKNLAQTRESPWYSRLFGKEHKFSKRQLENDLGIIKEYYFSHGFLDARVSASAHVDTSQNKIYISVLIVEGKRFYLDSLNISCVDCPPTINRNNLRELLSSEANKPFNPRQLHRDARAIQRFFRDNGHPYASAVDNYRINSDTTVFATIIVEPRKKGFFGKTTYSGISLTRQSVLEREMSFKEGELFSARKITMSREALYRTGLFSVVTIEQDNGSDEPETLDYKIIVAERKPQWVSARIGAGSTEEYDLTTESAVTWGHRNLFGTGREFSLQATTEWEVITKWANLRNRFDLRYKEPWVLGNRIPITLNLYFEPGNAVKIPQYKLQLAGINISASYAPDPRKTHQLYFNYERADVFDVKDPEIGAQILEEGGVLMSRRIGYTYTRDHRDNVLVPTEGRYFTSLVEFAGYFLGGDDHYTKINLGARRYINFRGKYVLGGRVKISAIGNWRAGEDVLPHQRFFLGGASSVRGWTERSIGPVSSGGDPRGGKLLVLSNLEFRFPIIWQFWGHTFFDMGNLWDNAEEFNPRNFKGSTGWGLALITPIGPVRFDYGYQIMNRDKPKPGETKAKNSNWHLSLMYSF